MAIDSFSDTVQQVKEQIIKRLKEEGIHQYTNPKHLRLFSISGMEFLDFDTFQAMHDNECIFFSNGK